MSRVNSSANTDPVNGERIVPPKAAAIATSAQREAPSPGSHVPRIAPNAPPMIRSGAKTPPEVPEPSAIVQMQHLTASSASSAPERCSGVVPRTPAIFP